MAKPPETQDLVTQGLGRVISQHQRDTSLRFLINMCMVVLQDLDDGLLSIQPAADVTTATGVNLEIPGSLVGQSKILFNGSVVSDAQYRLLIFARIARNTTRATIEDIIAQVSLIFGGAPVNLDDWGDMSFGLSIGKVLSSDEQAIATSDILPRPMGVQIRPLQFYDPNDYFTMAEDTGPHAAGFADDSTGTNVGGGTLAVEI